jgi:hypothetical protein
MPKEKRDHAGLFIPAGLFIGMALGFAYNMLLVGLFGGLGIGFLAFAIARVMKK